MHFKANYWSCACGTKNHSKAKCTTCGAKRPTVNTNPRGDLRDPIHDLPPGTGYQFPDRF